MQRRKIGSGYETLVGPASRNGHVIASPDTFLTTSPDTYVNASKFPLHAFKPTYFANHVAIRWPPSFRL